MGLEDVFEDPVVSDKESDGVEEKECRVERTVGWNPIFLVVKAGNDILGEFLVDIKAAKEWDSDSESKNGEIKERRGNHDSADEAGLSNGDSKDEKELYPETLHPADKECAASKHDTPDSDITRITNESGKLGVCEALQEDDGEKGNLADKNDLHLPLGISTILVEIRIYISSVSLLQIVVLSLNVSHISWKSIFNIIINLTTIINKRAINYQHF